MSLPAPNPAEWRRTWLTRNDGRIGFCVYQLTDSDWSVMWADYVEGCRRFTEHARFSDEQQARAECDRLTAQLTRPPFYARETS